MKASTFLQTYAHARRPEWEAAAVELAKRGELYPVAWVDVPVEGGGKRGVVRVSEDVLSLGEPGDAMRLPLTAGAAQAIANVYGALLPTKKLAIDINQAVRTRVQPVTYWPNPGANLESFAKHSVSIDQQIAALGNPPGLLGGHKKDVVVSNRTGAGKEMIYGWYAAAPLAGISLYTDSKGAKYIQPLSDIHDDGYVDYSHGIRLVYGTMTVDGREMPTASVYADTSLAPLVSDEGAIRQDKLRYGSSSAPGGSAPAGGGTASTLLSSSKGLLRTYLEGLRAEAMQRRSS